MIFGAVAIYLTLMPLLLLVVGFVGIWLGISFESGRSVWLDILGLVEGLVVFIGPVVVVVVAYRGGIRWLRRRAPRWLRLSTVVPARQLFGRDSNNAGRRSRPSSDLRPDGLVPKQNVAGSNPDSRSISQI